MSTVLEVSATVSQELAKLRHDRRAPDQPIELKPLVQLRSQVVVLGAQPPLLERGVQLVHELFELKRLRDEALGAKPRHLHRLADRRESGDHDGDDLGIAGEGFVQELASVHAGEAQIRNQDVERETVELCGGVLARSRLLDVKALLREPLRDDLSKGRLVFDEQEMGRRGVDHSSDGRWSLPEGCLDGTCREPRPAAKVSGTGRR